MDYDTDIRTDENGQPEDLWGALVTDDYRPSEVACSLIQGVAGTGKTTLVQQRIAEDSGWALLTSTTGISAVNLGAVTINSALGYFDEDSLRDIYLRGQLQSRLRAVAADGYRNLLVEECSMLTAPALDMLHRGVSEVCEGGTPLGIVLVGDMCQLPPVRGRWCFEADCWPKFAANAEVLTHVWRQGAGQGPFLRGLTLARQGDGQAAADALTIAGARWHTSLDTEFDGTTIVPVNEQVSRFNGLALDRVPGQRFAVASQRWGKQRGEWGQNRRTKEWGVPLAAEFKLGAYVMVLANASPGDDGGSPAYANGDCGHVEAWDDRMRVMSVRLVRTGEVVRVPLVVRSVEYKDKPDGWRGAPDKTAGYRAREHRNSRGRYVVGQVEYLPVRLAWCTTVHKSQSLSLDRVQVDFRHHFFKAAGMLYVALSRCRTIEGLRLVGLPEVFARHCNTDPAVRAFL